MVQEGFSLVFVLGAGALLLRPRDFPLFARAAGRLVGLTVRSMRASRDAAEKAIKESADLDSLRNPQMTVMRENLKHSLDQFGSLATAVRRDMADVPLNPTSLLRKGWRSWENVANGPARAANAVNLRKEQEDGNPSTSVWNSPQTKQATSDAHTVSGSASHLHVNRQSVPYVEGNGQFISGAHLVSRAIEEAALARQEQQVFRKAKDYDK